MCYISLSISIYICLLLHHLLFTQISVHSGDKLPYDPNTDPYANYFTPVV